MKLLNPLASLLIEFKKRYKIRLEGENINVSSIPQNFLWQLLQIMLSTCEAGKRHGQIETPQYSTYLLNA
ncbi:MAG: hypothetical protein AAF738_09500, partial [Bacteroidota bacterium]